MAFVVAGHDIVPISFYYRVVGEALTDGFGVEVGVRLGEGLGDERGEGLGDGLGEGLGDGLSEGLGDVDGFGVGFGMISSTPAPFDPA